MSEDIEAKRIWKSIQLGTRAGLAWRSFNKKIVEFCKKNTVLFLTVAFFTTVYTVIYLFKGSKHE